MPGALIEDTVVVVDVEPVGALSVDPVAFLEAGNIGFGLELPIKNGKQRKKLVCWSVGLHYAICVTLSRPLLFLYGIS